MTTTEELVAQACPQIGAIGPRFYFAEETLAVGKEHGLDGFRFYVLGRGGVLGDVEPAVVSSAFGYFEPNVIEKIWTSARERTSLTPREAGKLHLGCCREFGRTHFGEVAGLEEFCAAAEAVNNAVANAGLALYAGIAAEPLPDDLPGRTMQLTAVLREFRGSAHLLALAATDGIDPVTAHGVQNPGAWTMFGHSEDALPAGTDAQRAALEKAEALTDRLVAPAFDVLDEQGRSALLGGLPAMEQALPPMTFPGA